MIRLYPYTLFAKVRPQAFQDKFGDWVMPEFERVEIGSCRDEVNGSGSLITDLDGQKYAYSWIIYAPLCTERLEKGTPIEVEDCNGFVRLSGDILRFSKDLLHVRIWV